MADFIRIPLSEQVSRRDTEELASSANWEPLDVIPQTPETPLETIWRTPDGAIVHFIGDHVIGMTYAQIEGEGRDAAAAVIRDGLPTYDASVVNELWSEGGPSERLRAIFAAALLSAQDPQALEVLEHALDADDPRLRSAAIFASGYSGSRKLLPHLRRLAESEPSERVREEAQAAVSVFEEQDE